MDILKTRRQWVLGVAVLALVVTVAYGFITSGDGDNTKKGLILTEDVEISDEMRHTIESRMRVSRAALDSYKDPEDVDWNIYISLAWDAHLLGDLALGAEIFEEFLDINPLHHASWNNYGTVLKKMGNLERAEAAYKEAYSISANSEEYYRDHIKLIEENSDGERDEDIKAILEQAVSDAGQSPFLMIKLAAYYEERGLCTEMRAHLNVAKTLLEDDTEIDQDIIIANKNCLENQ